MGPANNGFYAGKKAFDLILNSISEKDKVSEKEINYNGFTIKLDPMCEDSVILGVGEPYATIAKKMNELFSEVGEK